MKSRILTPSKITIGVLLILILILLPHGPQAEMLEPSFDAGMLPSNGSLSVTHEFPIRNRGFGILRIPAMEATCGCTHLSGPKSIWPMCRGTVVATLTFDARAWGHKDTLIYVKTNDPNHPILKTQISATAPLGVAMVPASVDFSEVDAGHSKEFAITVLAAKEYVGNDFHIECLPPSAPDGVGVVSNHVAYSESAVLSTPCHKATFKIAINGKGPVGARSESLKLVTKSSLHGGTELVLPVKWKLLSGVHFRPESLFFGMRSMPCTVTNSVELISSTRPITPMDVSIPSPIFRVVEKTRMDEHRWKLSMVMSSGDAKPGRVESEMIVKFKNAPDARLKLGVLLLAPSDASSGK